MHEDQNHVDTDNKRGELIHTKPTMSRIIIDNNNDWIFDWTIESDSASYVDVMAI